MSSAVCANSIVIGGPPAAAYGNCIPFGCTSYGTSTIYQQVYASSNFSGPILIRSLSFLNTASSGGTIVDSTYSFTLTATPAAVNGLSTNFAANMGSTSQAFWSGNLQGAVNGSLTIVGTPFEYQPSAGNLLLQITRVPGSGTPSSGGAAFNARNGTAGGTFSRMSDYYNYNNPNLNAGYGLVTEFSNGGVPEPATLLLFPAGLAGIAIYRKKRRTA